MNTSDLPLIGVLITALFFCVSAPYLLTYLLYREFILGLARRRLRDKPAALFVASTVTGYLWLAGTFVLILFSMMGGKDLGTIMAFLFLLSIPAGAIGWLVLLIRRMERMAKYKKFVRSHPVPKLQIWLQDILVGAIALAFSLTVLSNFRDKINDVTAAATLVLYQVATQFLMFFAVLDVCRLSPSLSAPRARAVFLFALMFANGFVPMPLLTALAWNVWRRSLFLAEYAKPLQIPLGETV